MLEDVESHLSWILERVGRTEVVEVPVATAFGLALAENVAAAHDFPLWNSSAMDGYALRDAELMNSARFRVIGTVAAGSGEDPALPSGTTVRIMTGAPVPSDADTVVRFEDTEAVDGDTWTASEIVIRGEHDIADHVRQRGEDAARGERVGTRGQTVNSALQSALAAVGVTEVQVHRAPRIALITTGAELQPPGAELRRGQIPESNSLLIRGMIQEAGFAVSTVETCGDDRGEIAERIARLSPTHDVVITTGGVGPGLHDGVRRLLENEPEVRSLRVAVKPGQPQCTGRLRGGAFLFALPGNPVSAAVSFELFVRPALRVLSGHSRVHRTRFQAIVTEGWRAAPGRLQVLPVRLEDSVDGVTCEPAVVASQVSHSVAAFGGATGLAFVPPGQAIVRAGDQVTVTELGAG